MMENQRKKSCKVSRDANQRGSLIKEEKRSSKWNVNVFEAESKKGIFVFKCWQNL